MRTWQIVWLRFICRIYWVLHWEFLINVYWLVMKIASTGWLYCNQPSRHRPGQMQSSHSWQWGGHRSGCPGGTASGSLGRPWICCSEPFKHCQQMGNGGNLLIRPTGISTRNMVFTFQKQLSYSPSSHTANYIQIGVRGAEISSKTCQI